MKNRKQQPLYIFVVKGSPGVGKTFLCNTMSSIIRLDKKHIKDSIVMKDLDEYLHDKTYTELLGFIVQNIKEKKHIILCGNYHILDLNNREKYFLSDNFVPALPPKISESGDIDTTKWFAKHNVKIVEYTLEKNNNEHFDCIFRFQRNQVIDFLILNPFISQSLLLYFVSSHLNCQQLAKLKFDESAGNHAKGNNFKIISDILNKIGAVEIGDDKKINKIINKASETTRDYERMRFAFIILARFLIRLVWYTPIMTANFDKYKYKVLLIPLYVTFLPDFNVLMFANFFTVVNWFVQ